MTPADLARLHAAAFQRERPWSEAEFAELLSRPHVQFIAHRQGFALTRTVAGESELLTLAVDPAQQRRGIAQTLMARWLEGIADRAERAFLEVAADNAPAIALYNGAGFTTVAKRPGYYAREGTPPADALLMARALTLGQKP